MTYKISDKTSQSLIDELDELLEQERESLKRGELSNLGELLAKKEHLFEQLHKLDDLEQGSLDEMHNKIHRNQGLLKNAMQGIKAVANRLQQMRKVRTGLEVYDQSGRRSCYSTTGALKLEKRA